MIITVNQYRAFGTIRKLLLFIVGSVLALQSYSQEISWTNIHDLNDSMAVERKPVLIKIETSWCGYCKMMDAKVYSHKKVVKELVGKYYCVKLNGEAKETIQFAGRKYEYVAKSARSGYHELAKYLGEIDGQLNYPTTVILKDDYQLNKRIMGYLSRQNFLYWIK